MGATGLLLKTVLETGHSPLFSDSPRELKIIRNTNEERLLQQRRSRRENRELKKRRELEAIAEIYRESLKQGRDLDLEYRERLKREV